MQILLSDAELSNVQFYCQFVSDRQYADIDQADLLEQQTLCKFSRYDMYWIECKLEDINLGPLSVDPCRENPDKFHVSLNHCKCEQLAKLAAKWFRKQPEFIQQKQWVKNNIARFYDPVGGFAEYEQIAHKAAEKYRQHKIEVAKKYANEFADYLSDKSTKKRHALDARLKTENVYRNIKGLLYSGFDHLVWIYQTYVMTNPE